MSRLYLTIFLEADCNPLECGQPLTMACLLM